MSLFADYIDGVTNCPYPWYLKKGKETIIAEAIANWEYYEWNYDTNEWDFVDFGHLKAPTKAWEMTVVKSRDLSFGCTFFLNFLQKFPLLVHVLNIN